MEHIELGRLSVTNLALGGGRLNFDFPVTEVIDAYLELGGNFIDTAHCYAFWTRYGAGSSERAIADYFRRNGGREKVIIATKGGHPSAPGYRTTAGYLSPERIRADIEDSLGRLETDFVDLYWLHRDNESVPVSEVIDCLDEEVALGRIRELGASNWSTRRIAEANEYAARSGKQGFVASQIELNLASPPPETDGMRFLWREEEVGWHAETRFPVVAYSASAHGFFAGREDARYDSPVSAGRREKATVLAQKYSLTPQQVALAFVSNQAFPTVAIVSTADVEHLRQAAAALGTRIDAEDLAWLTA